MYVIYIYRFSDKGKLLSVKKYVKKSANLFI